MQPVIIGKCKSSFYLVMTEGKLEYHAADVKIATMFEPGILCMCICMWGDIYVDILLTHAAY